MNEQIDEELCIVENPSQEIWIKLLEKCQKSEGWNTHPKNYELWKNSFEKFWLIVALDRGANSPISSITLAKSKTTDGEALFLLGFYYCVPERRNRGIGSMLFKRVMQKIGDSNAVIAGGLNSDGMDTALHYQKRYGFNQVYSYYNSYVSIKVSDIICMPLEENEKDEMLEKVNVHDQDDSNIGDSQFEEFDEMICEMSRVKYLINWMKEEGAHSVILTNKEDDKVVSICCLREYMGGRIAVTPLYAINQSYAILSLQVALSKANQTIPNFQMISAVFPSPNEKAVASVFSKFSKSPVEAKKASQTQFTKKLLFQGSDKIFGYPETAHVYA